MNTSQQDRLARAFQEEERSRLRSITRARTAALVAIGVLLMIVSPAENLVWYYGLLAIFIAAGWLRFALDRSRWRRGWFAYAFIAFDFALITFTVVLQNPLVEPDFTPQFMLRFNNFVYLFVLLAALAISFRPRHLLWGGFCGAASWTVAVVILIFHPDTVLEAGAPDAPGGEDGSPMPFMLDPHFLDLGVQLQNIVVFLIVAGMLALATEASLRLMRRQAAAERRFLNLSRYVPAETVEELAARDAPFGAEDQREAAILFTDIVGFSKLAEDRPPREVIALLREAHGLVERAVFEHGGVLDKFIGDGAMATFGATQPQADAARRALDCAKAILAADADWNAARAGRGEPPVRISVGVHFGPVVVGDVGGARRMELAAIGDAVNVAARLETMTRALGVRAAISEEAYAAAGRPEGFEAIGDRPVEGRAGAISIWAIR